ncbi:MAG: hypothetical protein EA406_14570 [Rhodospirillales bacterium]|nr:MAG: hypothetical protein EA406_14570 [Rhodospirillales bacterium]
MTTDLFSEFEDLEDFEDFEGGLGEADSLADLEASFEDEYAGDFEGGAGVATDIGRVGDAVFERVLTGGIEATMEAEAADPFVGAAVGAVGRVIAPLLARWARSAIAQRLGRHGARVVRAALSVLQEVSRQTVQDVISYARSNRLNIVRHRSRLWAYAQRQFWVRLRQALARRGVPIPA